MIDFPLFLLMGWKFASSPVQVTDKWFYDGKHSPGMEGTLFPLVTVMGFQELVHTSRLAPQTPLRLSVVSVCPVFEYPAPWTPRASKDGDRT